MSNISSATHQAKHPSRFFADLRKSAEAQAVHIVLAIAVMFVFSLSQLFNADIVATDPLSNLLGVVLLGVPFAAFGLLLIQFYSVAFVQKSQSPIRELWFGLKHTIGNRNVLIRGLPIYLGLSLFMSGFAAFKTNISNIVPFKWDATLDSWDQALHFGVRPIEWLSPIFGNLPGTILLNVNYNLWFFVMQVFLVYFAFLHKPGVERTRFYLAFVGIWTVGGIGLAIFFSSVGPCFFGEIVRGQNPYAQHMAELREIHRIVPVWALDTQEWLWQMRLQNSHLGGVSAMPSMHNATALLFVLATWRSAKWIRWVVLAHCLMIFLGSIHLGWHYAVDSYIAWLITLLVWWASKPVAARWEKLPKVEEFNSRYFNLL